MTRALLVRAMIAAILALASSFRSSWAAQASAPPETLVRLSVTPAKAPEPALRYQLLPELKEISPGNPIEGYLRCHLEQYRFVFDEEGFERRQSLLAKPLEEPEEPFTREVPQSALAQADRAARLDNPDWQILLKIKADGVNTLLPDVQALRGVARSLQARFRTEVTRGQIDDALRTAKTMFAMARHMGEHPTLIGDLVAIAIANLAMSPLEELLEQPRCPNLFWALTDLPEPLISLRTGIDGERLILWTLFRELDSTSPMSAEQLKHFIDPLDALLRQMANKPGQLLHDHVASLAKDQEKVRVARERLVAGGLLESSVRAFPVEQVILLDEARECQARFDEIVKFARFPAWQFEDLCRKSSTGNGTRSIVAKELFGLTALVNGRRALARLEQRIDLLRHVEAVRMYAAEHGGALPAKLADIAVPLPVDPFTGKPFGYEVVGGTVHLRGTPPEAEQNNAPYRLHYEVTIGQ
jgi:hypothetical protein